MNNTKHSKNPVSWKILLPIGAILWILFGAVGQTIGIVVIAIGVVRLISDLVKRNKK